MKDDIIFTVGTARPFIPRHDRRLLLYKLNLYRDGLERVVDLTSIDALVDTSGQPFFKNGLGLFVPAWNSEYYICGRTYFKIFKSEDLTNFKAVYTDPKGTYGNHFFSDPVGQYICIGVGRGWKGSKGIVSYTPSSSYLLCSEDGGEHWYKVYELDYPTAIYDGVVIDDLILFTAREKCAVYVSFNKGKSFCEIQLNSTARNITYHRKRRREIFIVSSDDSFYISLDATKFWKVRLKTKGLVLRYPTTIPDHNTAFCFAGVGVRSWLLAVDLETGETNICDLTDFTGDTYASRLAVFHDKFFVGSELYGKLYFGDITLLRKLTRKDLIKLQTSFLARSLCGRIFQTIS